MGEWKNGNFNGQGTLLYASGDMYEGQWKDDAMRGHGKYTYADGRVLEGEWLNGQVYVLKK